MLVLPFLATSVFVIGVPLSAVHDPCDPYGDCVSSSVTYLRSNPNGTLYPGDSFSVRLSVITGPNTTGYSVSWSYDQSVFARSGGAFVVAGNRTGTFSVSASVTFEGNSTRPFNSTLTVSQSVTVVRLVISMLTRLVNVTGPHGFVERNPDGSFYRNDTFCDSWNATFQFAPQRTDISINVTSAPTAPSLRVLNISSSPYGRAGRFCYAVQTGAAYRPYNATLVARALNWEGVSLGLKSSSQPFAVVQYDPQFTAYAYMEYRNSTAQSSLERPWVLFVGYDGNLPGYSYAGDSNTSPFNGSRTLAERAYFSDFEFSTLSYQPFTTEGGVFDYHVVNSTREVQYVWLNAKDSAPLYGGNRIEKYVFDATTSTLSPLLARGFIYQNLTMAGCWQRQNACDLKRNYWLVPFLWNGRVNVVSVDPSGNMVPSTPISVTITNPSPFDQWLTSSFEHVFGNDSRALRAFQEDLYPTNRTMTLSGEGSLSILLNQTSLVPPQISITVGGVTLSGNFTFVPTFVNSTIASVPNPFDGTVFYANATMPLWSYSVATGSLAYLPVAAGIDQPSSFLELVNSNTTTWIAGNTTEPQTPAAFASQEYGFWPMGQNLTVYASLQGGGVKLLGTQEVNPDRYLASFYIEPWSGGVSSFRLVAGSTAYPPQPAAAQGPYQSPLPQSVTGLYTVSYPPTGQDTKVTFTNIWGGTTTIDLGAPAAPPPLLDLIPATTVTAFGMAGVAWLLLDGILKSRKPDVHR
jgi:hypothetical protein